MSDRGDSLPMICLDRGQIGQKAGLDITVKSAVGPARLFAPTWAMVRGHQAKTLDNASYVRAYEDILNSRTLAAWRWLTRQAQGGALTFLCYCPDQNSDGGRKFCHTNAIVEYMLRRWPKLFLDVRADS